MILERAGYTVISISNPDAAVRIFTDSEIDAVVFGDSIPASQRLALALKFKSLDQSVPIVALSNSSGSQFASGIVDEQLESLGDPHLLLEALKRVLARSGNGPVEDGSIQRNSAQENLVEKNPRVPVQEN
jgi:DNA-binding NtrC family response regulator